MVMVRLLVIAAVPIAIAAGMLNSLGNMNVFSMVVVIVAISVFGGVLREFVKSKKNADKSVQGDLAEIKQRLAQIEADLEDIKEQIADFIIREV